MNLGTVKKQLREISETVSKILGDAFVKNLRCFGFFSKSHLKNACWAEKPSDDRIQRSFFSP